MTGVTGARLVRKDGEEFDIAIHGFFLAIGHHPNSELFSKWVNVDENGYIITEDKSSRCAGSCLQTGYNSSGIRMQGCPGC